MCGKGRRRPRSVRNIAAASVVANSNAFPAKISGPPRCPFHETICSLLPLRIMESTSEEKRAEVPRAPKYSRARARVAPAARKLRQRMAITALTASQDTTLIIIRRLVTLVTLLAAFATRVNFFLRPASKKGARARARAKGSDFISL